MARHLARSLGSCVGLVMLVGACFDPLDGPSLDPADGTSTTTAPVGTSEGSNDTGTATSSGSVDSSSGSAESSSGSVDSSSGSAESSSSGSADTSSSSGADASSSSTEDSSGPTPPVCGNGLVEDGEECDDGNPSDTDDCPGTCAMAVCGDGFVLAGVEGCDDGNAADDDACLPTCVAASCGDGFVYGGTEGCDDGNLVDTDDCPSTCVPASCGDGFVNAGVEQCDDGGVLDGDGCGASCLAECGNPGGGALEAENGTGMDVMYCYEAADGTQVRAQKACESHFGVGNCCVITGGYQDQQYGQCGLSGELGTLHWHWDFHPIGHCEPFYVPGDVVSPGWCGIILGNFLD